MKAKNDKLRHLILKMLSKKAEDLAAMKQTGTEDKLTIPVQQIINELKISEEKFLDLTAPMIPEKEILFIIDSNRHRLVKKGENTLTAYYSHKYLKQGKETFRKDVDYYIIYKISMRYFIGSELVECILFMLQHKKWKQRNRGITKKVKCFRA
ncbi:MAG: hypothetical protein M3342_09705 [Bacteroidota bacterium]|nr:hypothetical protein [Bacteroidota bacterium]